VGTRLFTMVQPGSVTVLKYALSARDKEAASHVLEAALIRNVAATVIVCTEYVHSMHTRRVKLAA
jgi:hypothetical protein